MLSLKPLLVASPHAADTARSARQCHLGPIASRLRRSIEILPAVGCRACAAAAAQRYTLGETMQVMDFSRGQNAAIGITITPKSLDAFMAEFRNVKAALLDWKAKHKDRCERVMFTVVSAPQDHEVIESVLRQVYEDEKDLSPMLRSVNVDVALLDSHGDPVKEYSLGTAQQAIAPAQNKPW
jgi:hypothetical protein